MTQASTDPAPLPQVKKPLLLYDGDCTFCLAWVNYWKQTTGDRVDYEASQQAATRFPEIPAEDFKSAVQLILPDGTRRSGAHAAFTSLDHAGRGWMLGAYERLPGFAAVSEAAYGLMALHRDLGYWITRLLWGVPVQRGEQTLISALFLRLLGLIYLIAFASFGVQADGLIGANGILPIAETLPLVRAEYGAAGAWLMPTLFWLNASDVYIKGVWMAGILLALLLMLGWGKRFASAGCYVLYLSLVAAGQVFMGFQWDALLLEAGFLAIFLGMGPAYPWLYRWLLFRLMFMSGMVKLLSGDAAWRDLTALSYHYQTQPIPNVVAWYMHQLPSWFQKVSTAGALSIELGTPFLFFLPRRVRQLAALAIAGLQGLIILTGNYAFFNLLALALCLFLLDDALLQRVLPAWLVRRLGTKPATLGPRVRGVTRAMGWSVVALILAVSLSGMMENLFEIHFTQMQMVRARIAPFEIVNEYGLFAVMTTTRPEIVFEGSQDGVTWREYGFKYKAGDLRRRPPWVAPHQPRLDWQLWFAALGDLRSDPWVVSFCYRLLHNSPPVVGLLENNPFPGEPPRYVRAWIYEYRFTTLAEKRATGEWWHRELKGAYLPPISLENFRSTAE